MKNLTLYMCLAALAFSSVACNSDDPAEASEKKVYAEGENPYLRTNTAATTSLSTEFQLAHIDEPQYIDLKDYAPQFHKFLNMTVDEAMEAVKAGTVVFYNIKTSRNCWDTTPANAGQYGWIYDANGSIASEEANAKFKMGLDPDKKQVVINAINNPELGTVATLDFGFAIKNGSNFDDYVRFNVTNSITDPSKVVVAVTIPATGYGIATINFNNYDELFRINMGMSAADFIKAIDKDAVVAYLVKDDERVLVEDTDDDGNVIMVTPPYTSNGLGWWLDPDLNPCGWSDAGYPKTFMFCEYGGDGNYNFGNSDGASLVPSGTQTTLTLDFALAEDPDTYLQFIVAVTFE